MKRFKKERKERKKERKTIGAWIEDKNDGGTIEFFFIEK